MNRLTALVLLLCTLVPLTGFSQTTNVSQAAADIRLVNEAYAKSQRLRVNIGYALFPSYTSAEAFDRQAGVFLKQGSSTYSELLGIVSLRNGKVSVTVDSSEQTIVVADPPKKDEASPGHVNLDSLLKSCSAIEYRDLGKTKYYKLKFETTPFFEYNAIDVYINAQTHFLERLTLFFRAEIDLDEEEGEYTAGCPRLEITYSDITTTPVFAGDQFSETRFVQVSGKKVACAPAYAGYRLVNNKLK